MGAGTVPALRVHGQAHARGLGSLLVVDDDEAVRTLFLELFRDERVHVRSAGSGQAAMALAKQATPDLLIVDLSLPDRDGITVLEEALTIDSRMIGVVMTDTATVEQAVRAMKAGASDFLVKPMRPDAVVETVCRLLELHRMRAESQVLKPAALRSGSVRFQSLPFQDFGEEGPSRGVDGLTDYERGVADGQRQSEERHRDDITVLTNAARQLDAVRTSLNRSVEDDVIALAFEIVSKVLHESASACREQIIQQARTALGAIQEPCRIVIQAHPADAQILESVRAELSGRPDHALTISVEPMVSLPRGSCLVQTATRLIDASLDMQLSRLGQALKKRAHGES